MGQNFLVDLNVAQQIVKLVKPNNYDLVIEVGPGNGALTQYLVKTSNKMIAIELDKRLTESLRKQFNQYKNLEIINDDILNVSLSNIAQNYQNVLLISNLPYSISTPMLLHFLNQNTINVFYCMLQKELVDRLIAKPSHKTYGAISVLMQYYATINKIMNVDAQTFFPSPKISSNFILIKKHDDSKRFDVK
jgi:16S rRNA (adenine1518-N6/adenine1519-N6)-dimethyltransferase